MGRDNRTMGVLPRWSAVASDRPADARAPHAADYVSCDRTDRAVRHAERPGSRRIPRRHTVRMVAFRRRIRAVHAGQSVAAAVVGAVRRAWPILRSALPVFYLGGQRAIAPHLRQRRGCLGDALCVVHGALHELLSDFLTDDHLT